MNVELMQMLQKYQIYFMFNNWNIISSSRHQHKKSKGVRYRIYHIFSDTLRTNK